MLPDNTTPIQRHVSSSSVSRSSDDEQRTRPPPNDRKDFQRLMERRESKEDSSKNVKKRRDPATEEIEGDDEMVADSASTIEAQKRTKSVKTNVNVGDYDDEQQSLASAMAGQKFVRSTGPKESPFALYKQMASDRSGKATDWDALAQAGSDVPALPKEKSELRKQEKVGAGSFDEEQSEMSSVNPLAGMPSSIAAVGEKPQDITTSRIALIKELVDQIMDKLTLLESSGKTDTIVTLKQPGLFAGAQLVITEFKSAAKEFNLAFENLRPDAKQVLDDNIASLRATLLDNGYARALHIVTTTTTVEHRIIDETAQPFTGREKEDQQGRQQRRQQNPNEEA